MTIEQMLQQIMAQGDETKRSVAKRRRKQGEVKLEFIPQWQLFKLILRHPKTFSASFDSAHPEALCGILNIHLAIVGTALVDPRVL